MNKLSLVIILILLSSVSSIFAEDIQQTSDCTALMAETKEEKGEPEQIEHPDDFYGNKTEIWLYSADEIQIVFNWGPKYESCYKVTESTRILTSKGKKLRATRIKKEHPRWSERVCTAIAQKKIYPGMSKDQVLASWGDPDEKHSLSTEYSYSEQWIYGQRFLGFDKGILTYISQ